MAAPVVCSLAFTTTFLILFSLLEAREILVGGKTDAWQIPTSDADSLNAWAASSRFRIGDSLVWTYDGDKDSVLQVTRESYLSCNTTSPIKEYKGGNTTVKLERSGPHYFISGAEGHCEKGEKLIVVVLSPRHKRYAAISPAPSPAEIEGPAAAPGPMSSSAVSFKGGMVMSLGALVLLALF